MKKLIMAVVILCTGVANAQTDPTKEQTADYLQKNYNRTIYQGGSHTSGTARVSVEGNLLVTPNFQPDFSVSFLWTDSLNIRLMTTQGSSERKEVSRLAVSFNMKDIESINFKRMPMLDQLMLKDVEPDDIWPYMITFTAAGGQNLIKFTSSNGTSMIPFVAVPFGNARARNVERYLEEVKESQLYKAIAHFRKLSGASAPLFFR